MNSTQSDRDHAFDALRASMMLLGIVLHAGCNYLTVSAVDVWSYQDARTSAVADLIVVGIHTFRMPIFFVMAGYFTALLLQRRGATGMLQNRVLRVALPFGVFWTALQPLTVASSIFANGRKAGGDGLGEIAATLGTAPYWTDNTVHLWFLWYLTIFCAATAGGAFIVPLVPTGVRRVASSLFRTVMGWRLRALALALPMIVVLALQGGMLQTALSFAPNPLVLAGYLLFFGFGLALRHHRDLLPSLTRDAGWQLLAGVLLLPVNVSAAIKLGPAADAATKWQAVLSGAAMVWLLIFGITGLAMRWARHERPWVRYMTDASYWMYLMHLPLMLFFPGVMARWEIPALAKFALTIGVSLPLLLGSYHWLVRDTWIGALLNGRRYPATALRLRAVRDLASPVGGLS